MSIRTLYLPALIVAGVLMACAVVVLVVSQKKAEATFPGKNGRIAYSGFGGGTDTGIYTINPDGSSKTRIPAPRVSGEAEPSYSPNGKKIAYECFKALATDNEKFDPQICTIKAGGGDKTQITDTVGYASDPSWGSRP